MNEAQTQAAPASDGSPKMQGRCRSEEKRKQIVKASERLFVENGYNGVNMDQIAKAAGVSKQTVYSHFGTKQDLFCHCIQKKCVSGSISPDLTLSDKPLNEALLDFAREFNALTMSDDAIRMIRLCMSGAETHPEVSRLFFDAGPKNLAVMLAGYLDKQVAAGILKIPNSNHAAWQFLFMVKAEAPFRAMLGVPQRQSAKQVDQYIESCVGLFLRGYAT